MLHAACILASTIPDQSLPSSAFYYPRSPSSSPSSTQVSRPSRPSSCRFVRRNGRALTSRGYSRRSTATKRAPLFLTTSSETDLRFLYAVSANRSPFVTFSDIISESNETPLFCLGTYLNREYAHHVKQSPRIFIEMYFHRNSSALARDYIGDR